MVNVKSVTLCHSQQKCSKGGIYNADHGGPCHGISHTPGSSIKNERSPQRQNPWEFLLNMLILIHRCTNGITSPLPWAHHWSVGHWTPQSGRRVLFCVWCCSSLGSPPPYIPSGRSCCTGSDQWRLSEAERVAQSQSSCVWKKNYNFNIKI